MVIRDQMGIGKEHCDSKQHTSYLEVADVRTSFHMLVKEAHITIPLGRIWGCADVPHPFE